MTNPRPPPTNSLLTTTSTPTPKIGVIICSQRTPRIGEQIGTLIYNTLASTSSPEYTLSLIDLAANPLPLFSEPIIPQTISSPSGYHHEHTRSWSALISSFSAFVFVTPQYNWSFPASIKNAIDYLFNEWVGKPAMIVSYGGHGGGKAAEQLRQVLEAVRMRPVRRSVGLAFPKQGEDGRGFLGKAARGLDLGLDRSGTDGEGIWAKEMEDVKEAFGELVDMLQDGVEKE